MRKISLVLLVFAACGVSEKIYKRDVNALKDQIAQLEKDKEALIKDKNRLTDELALLSKEKGTLSADLKKALDKVEELKQMAAKRKAALDAFRAKLQGMISAGQLKVRTERGLFIVEMAEKVLFDVGKSDLKPEGKAAIQQLVPILMSLEGRRFQVSGHTDSTGSDEVNWRLSTNRGLSVVLFMIENGMPPERLSAAGYGRFQPVASNDTIEGRAQNRRIEIVIVPNAEELMIPEGE